MTVKEYLSQAYRIDQRINSKLEQVASLRALATKATSTLSDTPPSGSRNVQSMENVIVKIIDLENEINEDIDTLVDLKREIVGVIKRIDNPEYDIVAEIAEIGSGLSLNRPGIREMAGLAHRHMIDAVLVSDISRLCRDCGQTLRLEGKLKKQGVSIESIKGNPLPEYRRARIALGCIIK